MNPSVWAWQKDIRESFLSVVTLNEIRFGFRKVERRDPIFAAQLSAWYDQIVARPESFHVFNVDFAPPSTPRSRIP